MLQTDRKSTKQSQKRFVFSSLLHRTPIVAGGLVCAAVLVGFLFYVQTGLFIEQPPVVVSHTQTPTDAPDTDSSSEQPKKSVLDSQDSIEAPAPPSTPPPTSKTKKPAAAATCDQAAVKQKYERALSAENDFHQQSLQRISGISRIFGSLGLAKDQTKAENTRHNQVVERIEATYEQALAADTGC